MTDYDPKSAEIALILGVAIAVMAFTGYVIYVSLTAPVHGIPLGSKIFTSSTDSCYLSNITTSTVNSTYWYSAYTKVCWP